MNSQRESSKYFCLNNSCSKAQGTIEYLVIIAVVIVLALVVVGLIITQIDNSSQVSSSGNQLGLKSQVIGITESLIDPNDGNFVVSLLNNSGDVITVSKVSVGDSNVDFSEDLAQGGSRYFVVDAGVVCEEGRVVSEDVVITYVTREGLTKTEKYPVKVMFDCSPYVINQANLANQCPSCADLDPMYYGLGSGQTTCYDVGGNSRSCSGTGEDGEIYGSSYAHVWVDNGDGTVSDTTSGLMWQVADMGYSDTWQNSLDYCNNNTPGLPGSGWRLPTVNEINAIYDYSTGTCNSVFSGCNHYWSSTSVPAYPVFAYTLVTDGGPISFDVKDYVYGYSARCVRFEN